MSEEEAVGEVSSMATSKTRHSSSLGKVRKELEDIAEPDNSANSENESEREDSSSEENSSLLAARRKRVREAAE
jgi:hypothetical protein